jgi:hypothetical protein
MLTQQPCDRLSLNYEAPVEAMQQPSDAEDENARAVDHRVRAWALTCAHSILIWSSIIKRPVKVEATSK